MREKGDRDPFVKKGQVSTSEKGCFSGAARVTAADMRMSSIGVERTESPAKSVDNIVPSAMASLESTHARRL